MRDIEILLRSIIGLGRSLTTGVDMFSQKSWILASFVIGTFVVLVSGCSPRVEVQSNLNPDFDANLDRVLVIFDLKELDEGTQRVVSPGSEFSDEPPVMTFFSERFVKELRKAFNAVDVEAQFYGISGLELTDIYSIEEAKDYQEHEVLLVKESFIGQLKEGGFMGLMSTSSVIEITLDVKIFENRADDKVAWRAMIEAEAGPNNWPSLAKGSAAALVDQLVADGLVDRTNGSQ